MDVGQGDSILIQVNNKNLLIDSGPKDSKNNLLSYLTKLDINTLDYVIATHPHEDHIGNMATILNKYKVKNFLSPKIDQSSKTYEKMLNSLKKYNLKINVLKSDSALIDLGDNTSIKIYSPIMDKYDNINNYSPVFRITYGASSFLFTGDAEIAVEKKILSSYEDIKADVLKLGHHGSSSSSSKEFISKVNPSIAVISAGKDNSFGHPHKESLKTLKDNNIPYYRTDLKGSIIIMGDKKGDYTIYYN